MKMAGAVFVCLFTSTLAAQPGMHGGAQGMPMAPMQAALRQGPPAERNLEALKAFLGLGDAQVAQLQELQRQRFEATRTVLQEVGTKQRTLNEMLAGGTTDAAAVGALLLDLTRLRKSIEELELRYRIQAVGTLNPEQRTRLATLEAAQKLQPAIQQAIGLNLLDGPQGPGAGPGAPGGLRRGPGPF